MPQTLPPANAGLHVLGADVAKDAIVFHDSATGRTFTLPNDLDALSQGLAAFAACDWLVCETTGGYERPLLAAASAQGLRACRADAAQVKAFIASHGGRAKTDRIDAAWLSRYGRERADLLQPWEPPAPSREAFAQLMRHRHDLLAQRVQAKNRRSAPAGEPLHPLLDQQIAFLTDQIRQIDARLQTILDTSPDLGRDEQTLRTIPSIGPVVARSLIALLPEIGQLGPKQAASLAGLAPHPHESGQTRRRRHMTGGRDTLRPVLFMAALSAARSHPSLSIFYQRLLIAGKPKRLALAAVARKLVVIANAVLRDARTPTSQLT